MKIKQIFFVLVLCQSLNLSAQQFPTNIEYCWSYYADPPPGTLYYEIQAVGDTLIDDKSCIVLEGAENFGFDFRYINYEDDKIYRYSRVDSQFYLLYDFGLLPGDTLAINLNYAVDPNFGFPDTAIYQITSTDVLLLENDTLRVQYIMQLNTDEAPLLDWGFRLIERIGSDGFFVPYSQGQEIWISFSSATDGDEIIYKEFHCTVSAEEIEKESAFEVFPNPSSDWVQLVFNEANSSNIGVEIYNLQGQLVFNKNLIRTSNLSIGSLSKGYYILRVINEEGKLLGIQPLIKR